MQAEKPVLYIGGGCLDASAEVSLSPHACLCSLLRCQDCCTAHSQLRGVGTLAQAKYLVLSRGALDRTACSLSDLTGLLRR